MTQDPRPTTPDPTDTYQRTVTATLARVQPGVYVAKTISLRIDREQGEALYGLFETLNAQSARLKNGRHVEYPIDAVRWLLEQFHESSQGSGDGGQGTGKKTAKKKVAKKAVASG